MQSRALEFHCPVCGSTAITYTCEPRCCFNHVCGACGATVEPVTEPAGGRLDGVKPPVPPPDSCDPTAACAVCESLSVCMVENDIVVCADCGAVLKLTFTEVHPG